MRLVGVVSGLIRRFEPAFGASRSSPQRSRASNQFDAFANSNKGLTSLCAQTLEAGLLPAIGAALLAIRTCALTLFVRAGFTVGTLQAILTRGQEGAAT
jgi:hypothetical protein